MQVGILHNTMGRLSGGCKCILDTARALNDHDLTLYSSEKPNLQNWNYNFPVKWMQLPTPRRRDRCYPLLESMIKYMSWLDEDVLISTFGQVLYKPRGRLYQWQYFPFLPSLWKWTCRVYRLPYDYLIKRTIRQTEKLLVFSKYVKRITERFYRLKPEKIEVIPLSIDMDTFPDIGKKYDSQVVTIAAYDRWKHLEKVNEIARNSPRFHFHVIGRIHDLVYFNYLKSTKPQNVVFHVDLPNSRVKSILSKARYYLHVNYNHGKKLNAEHFGICIIEALASGCTVIAHNSGGPVEILDNGKYGFLYDNHDQVPSLLGSFFVKPNLSCKRAKMYDFSKFKKRLRDVVLN